jgi:hypothetical protein
MATAKKAPGRKSGPPITVDVRSAGSAFGIKGPPPPPPPVDSEAKIAIGVAGLKLTITVPGDRKQPVRVTVTGRRGIAFKGVGIKGPQPPQPPVAKKKAAKKRGKRSPKKLIKGPPPKSTDD